MAAKVNIDVISRNKTPGVLGKVGSALGGIMKVAGGILASQVFAKIGQQITGFVTSSITAASDLEESMNAVNVVFGDAAGKIEEFSKTSATAVGLSSSEFGQLGATMGAFLKNLGFDQEGAADKTLELTQRAADMASIFNTDVSQALEAVQSGLKGEFNPLENFGVKLNAAAISAKALEMGLADVTVDTLAVRDANLKSQEAWDKLNKAIQEHGAGSLEAQRADVNYKKAQEKLEEALGGTTDALTDSQKAQAALALIMQQTDQVAGDFANTSEGYANQQRIFNAQLENSKAALGGIFLPLISEVMQVLNSEGIPILNEMIDNFKGFFEQVRSGQVDLGWFGDWWSKHGKSITESVERIRKGFLKLVSGLSKKIQPFVKKILGKLQGWFEDNGPLIEEFAAVVAEVWEEEIVPAIIDAWDVIEPVLEAIFDILGELAEFVMKVVVGDWEGAWESIEKVTEKVVDTLIGLVKDLVDWILKRFDTDLEKSIQIWKDNWEQLKQIVSTVAANIIKAVSDWLSNLITTISNAAANFINAGRTLIDKIKEGMSAGWTTVVEWIKSALKGLAVVVGTKLSEFVQKGKDLVASIKQGITDAWDSFVAWVKSLWQNLIDDLNPFADANVEVGANPLPRSGGRGRGTAEGLGFGSQTVNNYIYGQVTISGEGALTDAISLR